MKNIVAKGTIYLMIAQFFTSVFGYLIHIGLARFMGPASYGTFGVILSIFLITKTIFLTGTNRAISKYVAEKKYSAYSVLKTGAKLQFLLVGVALLFYIFFSESLAEFFNDPSLATPLLISSFILLPLALYILLSKGLLNGLRIFPVQAYLESSHSFVKLCVSFLLVYLGYGVFGALIGYIIGPLVAFVLGLYYIQKKKLIKKDSTNFSYKKLIHFALPITLFYMMATSTMEIGVLMLKFFHGSNVLVGYYTSATTLGKMSFSLFSALPFTMLPSISYAASNNNLQLIQRYIQKS
ncbi:oligosaccharide flippase family protein, partial [Candidatus Woesearchaeota archaeon]|nr:oligosaccharide flippase family protein [Candidatus Woesearchaeota archaeon]